MLNRKTWLGAIFICLAASFGPVQGMDEQNNATSPTYTVAHENGHYTVKKNDALVANFIIENSESCTKDGYLKLRFEQDNKFYQNNGLEARIRIADATFEAQAYGDGDYYGQSHSTKRNDQILQDERVVKAVGGPIIESLYTTALQANLLFDEPKETTEFKNGYEIHSKDGSLKFLLIPSTAGFIGKESINFTAVLTNISENKQLLESTITFSRTKISGSSGYESALSIEAGKKSFKVKDAATTFFDDINKYPVIMKPFLKDNAKELLLAIFEKISGIDQRYYTKKYIHEFLQSGTWPKQKAPARHHSPTRGSLSLPSLLKNPKFIAAGLLAVGAVVAGIVFYNKEKD